MGIQGSFCRRLPNVKSSSYELGRCGGSLGSSTGLHPLSLWLGREARAYVFLSALSGPFGGVPFLSTRVPGGGGAAPAQPRGAAVGGRRCVPAPVLRRRCV